MKKILIVLIPAILILIVLISIDLNQNKIKFKKVNIEIKETKTNKSKVYTIKDLILALENNNIKLIELQNDLDLGYNLVKKEGINSKYIQSHNTPLTHPILKQTGVSKLNIKNKNNLIIYSKNGYKLLHTNIRIINSKNIKLDNIKMEEMWEWDEKTKAEYDRNDWDYITIQNSNNIQIKNCEFSKSYDGITDIKNSKNVTIEYSKVNEMNLNDKFYSTQFDELENNIDNYPMYKYLRKEVGLSKNKIKKLQAFQFKLYLIGPKDYGKKNENIIIHDTMFENVKTRIPLARNSSVYLYNIYFDASKINHSLVTKEQKNKIKNKYLRIVCLDPYGPISIQKSYIVVKNSIFKGTVHKYTWYRGLSYKNLGKIIIKNDKKKNKNLKQKLEKKSGCKIYS